MSDRELIRRIAARYLLARDFFEIGDPILFGKYKNKKGVIVGWGTDHKGNPTVFIDPIPKGRKKTKEMGLFKFWHNPPPAIAKKLQEEAAAQMKLGCIIAGRKFDDDVCLFKNRDRAYDAAVDVVHLENDGTEMAIIFDPKTGYIEGVNEHGIGIVNTALMVERDEAEGKGADKAKDKGKKPVKSKDGPKIYKALASKNLSDAVDILITEDGGIKGHTFVSDGKKIVCIECSRTHPARVTTLDPERTNTRTNHGISYPDAGYTEGDDYVSSIVRRWEAQKRIQDLKHPEDIGPALMETIHKKDSPFNPVRDTDTMRTTSQLLINTTRPRMILYLIPGHGKLNRVRNMLPDKREPKIPVRVINYEGEQGEEKIEEKDTATDRPRTAARYKSKKQVKKQDGGEMTVYEYSDRQIADRNRGKAERIEKLRKSVDKLRTQVAKDMKSGDEKKRAIALAVALMDHTFERVGNEGSAKEGHFGVTTWQVKHIKFKGNKATIKYVGKSGVDQKKEVTDTKIVSALKAVCKDKGQKACLVDAKASDVNEYLKPFDISAKDIRGFHANTEMKAQLKKVRSGKLPTDKKEKEKLLKEEFKKALEETAKAVGHEPSTLKSQYLVPGLEDGYLKDGTVNESHTKSGGRKEKEDLDREDEQAQKMLRKEPKKKPPRYDLRDNRTLKERDKDMEGLDGDDGGDKDLQDDVRRYARRVAFRWLALPREPSAVRVAMWKQAAADAAKDNRGKHWKSPTSDYWMGQDMTGDTRGFESEEAAKSFSRGEKSEKEKDKKKKRKKKKDEVPKGDTTEKTEETSGGPAEAEGDTPEKPDTREEHKAIRDYTDEELDNETGEYFENDVTMAVAPGAFVDAAELKKKIQEAATKTLGIEELKAIGNTDASEIAGLDPEAALARGKELAEEYERDWGRIEQGFTEGAEMPPPIVLRDADGNMWLMAGNTRMMGATAMGKSMPVKIIDVPKVDHSAAPGEAKIDEKALTEAKQDVEDQQKMVDDMMKDLETVEDDKREKLEEEIIAERAALKEYKDKVKEIETPAEEKPEEDAKPEDKAEEPKEQTPEEKRQEKEDKRGELEAKVNELQKQIDDGKDADGDRLLEDERLEVEKELTKARDELGKANEELSAEDATKSENERTEQIAKEMHKKEKKKNPGTTKTKEDFAAQARAEAQKEVAKELSKRNVTEAEKTIESIIGPGSGLSKEVRESLTTALGNLDDDQKAEFAAALKQDLGTLVADTEGTSKTAINIANKAANTSYDGIKDPKKLAKAVAEAAYARNVVANPKILGGTPISENPKTQEELSARALEAVAHYRELDPSLRNGAAETLTEELKDMDPKSNRAKEINHILTGIATASALSVEIGSDGKIKGDPTVPGRPQPSAKAVKLLQAMDKRGHLEQMFKPIEDLTSPEGRAAIGDALRELNNEDLIDQITDGKNDHPLSPLTALLNDEDLDPVIRAAIREALIGMSTDGMTWGDRAIREVTGENDLQKRQDMMLEIQGGKENRALVSGIAEAAKNGETEKFAPPTGGEGENEDSKEETTSLLDVWRAAQAQNLLEEHSDAAEENKTSPAVAVYREFGTSKNPSVMDSEVEPHPEEFWATQRGKKTASESQLSAYRTPHISEGLSYVPVQNTAPPARRQSSMTNLTEKGARQVTADLDRLANLFQNDHDTLGIPAKVAEDMALRCDMLSDRIETQAGMRPREATMDPPANYTEEKVAPNEFNPAEIGEEQSQALLRNEDEPYMDAFKQDEFDELRQVQQDGMFSNAKAAAALVKKMAAALAKAGHPQFSAQKKSDLNASSNELEDLAASLERLGNLDEKIAKFHEAAGLGHWTDFQAEEHIRQLTELERQLADAEAEIEALAGEVLKRKKSLEADHKKRIEQLKKELPQTIAGQKKMVVQVRDAIIKYAKVAEKKRPGVKQMLGDPNRDIGSPVAERGGELLQRVEAELGDVIAQQVAEIYDTVMEEITVLTPTVRGLEYELKQKDASDPKTASEEDIQKEAGVMSLLVKFRDWLVRGLDKMKRLFGMGTKRISNAAKKIDDAINKADKGWDMAMKTGSEHEAGEIPEAFKENIEKMKAKSKDKDGDDDKDDDKKDDKKASHGYELSA